MQHSRGHPGHVALQIASSSLVARVCIAAESVGLGSLMHAVWYRRRALVACGGPVELPAVSPSNCPRWRAADFFNHWGSSTSTPSVVWPEWTLTTIARFHGSAFSLNASG